MKSASLVELLELSEQVGQRHISQGSGIVVASFKDLYCIRPGRMFFVDWRPGSVWSLAFYHGALYDAGDYGIMETITNRTVTTKMTHALIATPGGLVRGCNKYVSEDKTYGEIFFDCDEKCLCTGRMRTLAFHEGDIYWASPQSVHDASKKERVSDVFDDVQALASHKGRLYCAYNNLNDRCGCVVDVFGKKVVAKRKGCIQRLVSNDGELYDAGHYSLPPSKGGYWGNAGILVLNTLDDPLGKKALWGFADQDITAMASVPMKLWEELAKRGKEVQR